MRASGLCLSLRLDEPCFIYVLYYIPSLYAYYLYIAWVPILCLSNPLRRGSTMPNGQNKKEKRKFVTKNAHLFNLLLFRGNNGVEFQTNRHREWVSGGLKIANVKVNVFCSLILIWWLRMYPFNRMKIKEGTTYWYTHVTHSCTRIYAYQTQKHHFFLSIHNQTIH